MKKIVLLLSLVLCSIISFGQFVNTTTVGSASTDYKSKGGLTADSVIHLAAITFADTTAANFSVASKYSGSLIQVAGGQIWWRSLNPNQWHIFASSTGGGYVLISDTSAMLAHYLRISDTAYMLSNRLKISDTATMLSNRLKISDTITMLSGYARTGNVVPNTRTINTNAPLVGGGDLSSDRTFLIDTGRANAEVVTGGSLNKVRDSLQANINASVSGVSSVSTTDNYGISSSVANPTSTPNISIGVDTSLIIPYTDTLKINGIATKTDINNARTGGTVTSVSAGVGMNFTTITTTGSVDADTLVLATRLHVDSVAMRKLNISDTATMLSNLLRKTDTSNMLLPYLRKTDTASMLTSYTRVQRFLDTTSTLRALINTKGTGTVTSVGLSMPSIFSVSNSPVTTSGTLTTTLANQNANLVFASPTTGSPAQPTFRALVAADLPDSYLPISDTAAMLLYYQKWFLPNIVDSSAIGDSTINNTILINRMLNDTIKQSIYFPAGAYYMDSITNIYGYKLNGPGVVVNDKSYSGVPYKEQISSYSDEYKPIFGQEYLSHFHNKILTRSVSDTVKVSVSGNSVVASHDFVSNIQDYTSWLNLQNFSFLNDGHDGKSTAQWLSTYLDSDLAQNPDLYIVWWGINDAPLGVTQFLENMENGLRRIRAAKDLSQMSVIILTPSSTYDLPSQRDSKFYEKVSPGLAYLARKYQCAFVDIYGTFPDSKDGVVGNYMDNPYGDGRTIHPLPVLMQNMSSKVQGLMYPTAIIQKEGYTNYKNINGSVFVLSTETPSFFQSGASAYRVTNTSLYPLDGFVFVERQADGGIKQKNIGYNGELYSYERYAAPADSWTPWIRVGAIQSITNGDTLSSPSSDAVYDTLQLYAKLTGAAFTGNISTTNYMTAQNVRIKSSNTDFWDLTTSSGILTFSHNNGSTFSNGPLLSRGGGGFFSTINNSSRFYGTSLSLNKDSLPISTSTSMVVIGIDSLDASNSLIKRFPINNFLKVSDTASMLANRLKISDTSSQMSGYARTGNLANGAKFDTSTLQPRFNLTVKYGDTAAMLGHLTLDRVLTNGNISGRGITVGSVNANTGTFNGDLGVNGLSGTANITLSQNYSGGNPGIGIFNTDHSQYITLNSNNGAVITTGSVTASSLIKSGGTSSQALIADGSVLTLTNGTYTPTISNTSNVSSSSASEFQYMRVGNTVTVSGSVTATATSGVSTIALEITLPIASTFTQNYQCAGTGAGASGLSAANTLMVVNADTSTHLAYCQVFPGGTASTQYWLHFTYQIL